MYIKVTYIIFSYRFLFTVSQKMFGHGEDPTQRFTILGWRTSSRTVLGSNITHISKICQFLIMQNSKLYQGTSSVFLIEIRHPLAFSSKKIEKIPSGSSTFKLFLSDKADDCRNDQNCELQCTAFSVTKISIGKSDQVAHCLICHTMQIYSCQLKLKTLSFIFYSSTLIQNT